MIRRNPVAAVVAATIALALGALVLTSCGAVGASNHSVAPSAAPSAIAPDSSGSTDIEVGRRADELIAQFTELPARTKAVGSAPNPALETVASTLGCGEAQRSIFWIANGWTTDALAGWFRQHPVSGFIPRAATTPSGDPGLTVQEWRGKDASGSPAELFTIRIVPLGLGIAGVRIDAEVAPESACLHPVDGGGTDDR